MLYKISDWIVYPIIVILIFSGFGMVMWLVFRAILSGMAQDHFFDKKQKLLLGIGGFCVAVAVLLEICIHGLT